MGPIRHIVLSRFIINPREQFQGPGKCVACTPKVWTLPMFRFVTALYLFEFRILVYSRLRMRVCITICSYNMRPKVYSTNAQRYNKKSQELAHSQSRVSHSCCHIALRYCYLGLASEHNYLLTLLCSVSRCIENVPQSYFIT